MAHIPVLVGEIVSIFANAENGIFIDATYGLGGHSKAISEKLPGKFRIIGFDRDNEILKQARATKPEGVSLYSMSFSGISNILKAEHQGPVTGILFDLGLNSEHIDNPDRGFSYSRSAPLDLRFDRTMGKPAYELISKLNQKELVKILWEYGQERHSRKIAKEIIKNPPETTDDLSKIIKNIVPSRGFIKTASRVFQALRIFVNDELNEIKTAFESAVRFLSGGGIIAVISYHSIEDGIVKKTFQKFAGRCFCGPNIAICECGAESLLEIKTRKPLYPSNEEIKSNSRARSARLRYAQKI